MRLEPDSSRFTSRGSILKVRTAAIFLLVFVLMLMGAPPATAGTGSEPFPRDLTSLSLEELMEIDVTVTSVSKKTQKLSEAAAAVFVITQEDIRRSGATTIPEVLRMVPGLQVARIDANKWAISSRGFNGRFSNKLLVLIDGRSVYTPLFSGVFWDMQDLVLEDVERIEVIRGPGATLWGANAVNGVINIITKKARDTQGGLLVTGAGTEERGFGTLRYGSKAGEDAYWRIYIKYFNRDNSVTSAGEEAADSWDVVRAGFRVDWDGTARDSLTLQGDIFDGESGVTYTAPTLTPPYSVTASDDTNIGGGNLIFRWRHTFTPSSEFALQLYYDRTEIKYAVIGENRDTFDIDFQHRFPLGGIHDILWGLGYRFTKDDITNSFYISLDPQSRSDNLYSAFVQDEVRLVENRLYFTAGSKFEYNNYTGFEVQPSARLLWTPDEKQSVWTAVSRAVRTPSRADDDIRINQKVLPGPPLTIAAVLGDRSFESEDLLAFELGYRIRPVERLSFDIAAFYNIYDNLRTLERGQTFTETTPAPSHVVVPSVANNMMDGETYGVEAVVDWLALDWWELQLAYTYLRIKLRLEDISTDTTSTGAEGESPRNQVSLRSSMDIRKDLDLDMHLRYVDDLPGLGIPGYLALDVRLGWRPVKDLEVSVTGQNLFDNSHPEFVPELINILHTEVERSVYGKITWRF